MIEDVGDGDEQDLIMFKTEFEFPKLKLIKNCKMNLIPVHNNHSIMWIYGILIEYRMVPKCVNNNSVAESLMMTKLLSDLFNSSRNVQKHENLAKNNSDRHKKPADDHILNDHHQLDPKTIKTLVDDFSNLRIKVEKLISSMTIDAILIQRKRSELKIDHDPSSLLELKKPLISVIGYLNQNELIYILTHHVMRLCNNDFKSSQESLLWIYSVLSCVKMETIKKSFHPLSLIVQKGIGFINSHHGDDSSILAINLIICIINYYFLPQFKPEFQQQD